MLVETLTDSGKRSSVELMFSNVENILDYLTDAAEIWSSHWPAEEQGNIFEVPTEESLVSWFAGEPGKELVVMMGEAEDGFEFEVRVWCCPH